MTLADFLRQRGLRITIPRQHVFNILQHYERPISIATIVAEKGTVDRTSVYRTLELFAQLGIITIVPMGWKKKYELAGPFKPHHHHLECTGCGQLVPINAPEVEQLIDSIAAEHHYQLSSHHIELRGTCKNCRRTANT